MTTAAAQVGNNILDVSVDSVQISARKGEDVVFEYSFSQPDTSDANYNANDPSTWVYIPVDVSAWTFMGGVRDGSAPTPLPMDIVKLSSASNDTVQVSFDTTNLQTTIAANSSRDFFFEIEAHINTTRTKSDGTTLTIKKSVLVGIIKLFADLFVATINP